MADEHGGSKHDNKSRIPTRVVPSHIDGGHRLLPYSPPCCSQCVSYSGSSRSSHNPSHWCSMFYHSQRLVRHSSVPSWVPPTLVHVPLLQPFSPFVGLRNRNRVLYSTPHSSCLPSPSFRRMVVLHSICLPLRGKPAPQCIHKNRRIQNGLDNGGHPVVRFISPRQFPEHASVCRRKKTSCISWPFTSSVSNCTTPNHIGGTKHLINTLFSFAQSRLWRVLRFHKGR